MSHTELLVHGYFRLNFEQYLEYQVIPFDNNIKYIFCDYFGYKLCCIAFTKKKQLPTNVVNNQITSTDQSLLEEFQLNEIQNLDKETIIIKALYSAIASGHISCFNYLTPKQHYPSYIYFDEVTTSLWIAAMYNQPEILKLLLQTDLEEMDPNKPGPFELTPLMIACREGSDKSVNILINLPNIQINTKAVNGSTALNIACEKGHIECVKQLLNHKKVLIDEPKTNGRSPFWNASYGGYYDIVKLLLNHSKTLSNSPLLMINVNRCDSKGFTALYAAARTGHVDVVKLLLENDADPSILDYQQHSPLWSASARGRVDVLRILITHPKIDVNGQDHSGTTPLGVACQKGHTEVVELLLNPNTRNDYDDEQKQEKRITAADPNISKYDGCTPLWVASALGQVECVKLLIKHGADVSRANKEGATPLFAACQNGWKDVVDLLLTTDIDINKERSMDKTTPIMMAACNGHDGIVNELLKHGADITWMNDTGLTVFGSAVMNASLDTIKVLYEYLKESEETDEEISKLMEKGNYMESWTPLMVACMHGHDEIAKYLVHTVNVDILRKDGEGKTAMQHALEHNHQSQFSWLAQLEHKLTDHD